MLKEYLFVVLGHFKDHFGCAFFLIPIFVGNSFQTGIFEDAGCGTSAKFPRFSRSDRKDFRDHRLRGERINQFWAFFGPSVWNPLKKGVRLLLFIVFHGHLIIQKHSISRGILQENMD